MELLFFQLLSHLINLDIAWFIQLIMSNLHWLFFWAALGYFIVGKNKMFWGGMTIFVAVYIALTFTNIVGWTLLCGAFLSIHYLVRMVLMIFTENVEAFKPYFILILSLQFIVTLAVFNLFMGG